MPFSYDLYHWHCSPLAYLRNYLFYRDWGPAAIQVCVLSGWSGALLLHGTLLEGCRLWSSPPESRGRGIIHHHYPSLKLCCLSTCAQLCLLRLFTWWDASWISLMTVLLSLLRGQDTTMNPAKCKPHSRASRLISRTYVTQKDPTQPPTKWMDYSDKSDNLWKMWEKCNYNLLVTHVSHLFVTQGQHSSPFPGHFLVDFVVTCWTFCKLQLQIRTPIDTHDWARPCM